MLLIVIFLAGLFAAPHALAEESVRIAVGRFQTPLEVNAPNILLELDDLEIRAKDKIVLSVRDNGIHIAGKTYASDQVRIKADHLEIRGHQYRKSLEVQWRSYRGRPELLVVHPIPIETYVVGIVSSELPRKWPLEALKAQAIAARTYAIWQKYRRLDLPYHMESSILDQVYHGVEREHPDAKRAVAETYGQVLTFERRPVNAYFHSTCGGRTESAEEGWGKSIEYLPGSECGYCENANRYNWQAQITWRQMNKAFRKILGEDVKDLRVISKTSSGRVKKMQLIGNKKRKLIAAVDVRRLLGYTLIWSTALTTLEKNKKGFIFKGHGAGHGVGMCQWGAKGMAEANHNYEQILSRYYPGAELSRMY